jgi:hypothetical protein
VQRQTPETARDMLHLIQGEAVDHVCHGTMHRGVGLLAAGSVVAWLLSWRQLARLPVPDAMVLPGQVSTRQVLQACIYMPT